MKIKRVEHIAIAVDSIAESAKMLRDTFGIEIEYEEDRPTARLAMLPIGETYLELLQGNSPDSAVTRWIDSKGTGLFHICFEV
ncbi:MAG TPA: VOC family protein, partial [Acetobacteraceae bacterium]|nr:VOC family protein [Acetobacteraceae bacterium]